MGYLSTVNSFAFACAPYLVALVRGRASSLQLCNVWQNTLLFAGHLCHVRPEQPGERVDPRDRFCFPGSLQHPKFPPEHRAHDDHGHSESEDDHFKSPAHSSPIFIQVQAGVALKRIDVFMNSDELDGDDTVPDPPETEQSGPALSIQKATFLWGAQQVHSTGSTDTSDPRQKINIFQDANTLSDIDMDVTPGSLVAVVGTVGAGKSSLVAALLGEMEKVSGEAVVRGTVAFAAQQVKCHSPLPRGTSAQRGHSYFAGLDSKLHRQGKHYLSLALRPRPLHQVH